jgi:hypothetical protein
VDFLRLEGTTRKLLAQRKIDDAKDEEEWQKREATLDAAVEVAKKAGQQP